MRARSGRGRGVGRAGHARAGAAALALTLALAGCGAPGRDGGPSGSSGAAVTLVHADTPLESAVAAVAARHLREAGHPVTVAAADGAAPWSQATGGTVAVVDTLRMALRADPSAVLPREDPSDASARAAEATASSPSSLAPIDPSAPPRVPATPSSEAAAATALARGPEAGSPEDAQRIVDAALGRVAAGGDVGAPASSSALASSSAPASSGAADAPRVLSASAGVLQLAAVTTSTLAARDRLDSIDDLNGRCDDMTVAVPAALALGEDGALDPLRQRLDAFAGCRPEHWLTDTADASAELAADRVQVALEYRVDPDIPPNGLVALDDGGRALPAGRVAVVGEGRALDDDVEARLREVMEALDEEGLAELLRITTGPDALAPEDAAQYWLVSQHLEDAPEGWVVPADRWF